MQQGKISLRLSMFFFILYAFIAAAGVMAHEWMAPATEGNRVNPVTLDDDSTARGRNVYVNNCAVCHGDNIEGMKSEESSLEMDTPDLKKRLLTHTDGDFFWKIMNGRGEMPSFGDDLSETEVWDVINYLRSEAE